MDRVLLEEPMSPLLVYKFHARLAITLLTMLAPCPYPEEKKTSLPPPPHTHTQIALFKTCVNTFNLPNMLTFSKPSLLFRLSSQALYTFHSTPTCDTQPPYFISRDLTTKKNIWTSKNAKLLIMKCLELLFTSSLLSRTTSLSTLFSNTLSPCSSFNAQVQVSHPHKTSFNI